MGALVIVAMCNSGRTPRAAEREIVFRIDASQKECLFGEPVIITVGITNKAQKPMEETWTDISRVLVLELSTEGRKVELYRFFDMPSVEAGQGKMPIPPNHTLRFSFVLNFPGEPVHGVASALGYSDPENGEWRGDLLPGKYRLQARLYLASRYMQATEQLWKAFVKEQNIKDEAKATDEQLKRFAEMRDKQLGALRTSSSEVEYNVSTEFEVAKNDAKNDEIQNLFRSAVVACAKTDGAGYDAALQSFRNMFEKAKGSHWETWAQYCAGRVLMLKKKPNEAIQCFDKVAALAERGGYLYGSQLVLKKKCFEALGETKKAEDVNKSLKETFGTAAVFAAGVIELKESRATAAPSPDPG
jgi:hypothetical protein